MAITDLSSGGKIVDTWISAVQNNVGDAWSTYTLSITGATTNPTQGNSTYGARYRYLNDHTVVAVVRVQVGSTFSVGSGFYSFSLPVNPAEGSGYGAMGSCYVLDNSSGIEYAGIARIFSSKVVLQTAKQDAITTSGHPIPIKLVASDYPMIPASGDDIRFSITYEV